MRHRPADGARNPAEMAAKQGSATDRSDLLSLAWLFADELHGVFKVNVRTLVVKIISRLFSNLAATLWFSKHDHVVHAALSRTAHRPWPLPHSAWRMRQRWCDLLFAHWP